MAHEDIRKMIRKELMLEAESRSRLYTFTSKIVSNMRNLPGVEKVLAINSFAQGTVGVIRYEDGNVYEVIVRPGSQLGKDYPIGQFKNMFGTKGGLLNKKGKYVDGVRLKDIKLPSDL